MQRKMSDSDASSATEAYAQLEKSEVAAPPVVPVAPNHPPAHAGNDDTLAALSADMQNYLNELKQMPATDHPKLAKLIPTLIWAILLSGVFAEAMGVVSYRKEAAQHPQGSPENIEATKLSQNFTRALVWTAVAALPIVAFTSFYLGFFYRRLHDGEKIPQHRWNEILNNLEFQVIYNLQALEAAEELRNAPDTLLPIDKQDLRTLEAQATILKENQPRLTLINTFTTLRNIIETLRAEIPKKQRPLVLMFAQPQDDMGLANLFAHPDDDLEAGVVRRPN